VKVIYYCDWFEEYTASLAIAIAAESNETTVIVRRDSAEFEGRRDDETSVHNELLDAGVDLHRLAGKYSSIKSFLVVQGLFRSRRRAGYEYFHLQQTGDPRLLWPALRMRTILTLHEPTARPGVVSGANRWREFFNGIVMRGYRRLANVIMVHTVNNLEGLTPRERRKVVVIPHGVRPMPVLPAEDSKTILFFGRAAAYKGIDTLFAAMLEVWKFEPTARLRVLASPGDYANDRISLDARVSATWDGYSNHELESALSSARAVCLPYLSASGSGVGAQAYGSGKPIVASDLEGLRELVAHDELRVRPADAKDLARALIAVLRNDYGPQEVDSTRTWSGVAEAHIAAYRSISNGRR